MELEMYTFLLNCLDIKEENFSKERVSCINGYAWLA